MLCDALKVYILAAILVLVQATLAIITHSLQVPYNGMTIKFLPIFQKGYTVRVG